MKKLIGILSLVVIIYACNSSKKTFNSSKNESTEVVMDTIRIVNEELEYEIMILDIGFDSWLVTQRPITYYSQSTLEIKNNIYVIAWNERVRSPNIYDSMLYEQIIDYSPNIDYGEEVNYMLYMYFQFFQKKYNQKLSYIR